MQWKRIPAKDIPGTVWEKVDLSNFNNRINFANIDRLFEAQRAADENKPSTQQPPLPINAKSAVVSAFLSVDNKIQISILLGGKSSVDENVLARALDEMNDSIFTPRLCAPFKKSFDALGVDDDIVAFSSDPLKECLMTCVGCSIES